MSTQAAQETQAQLDDARAALVLEWQQLELRTAEDRARIAEIKTELEQLATGTRQVPGTEYRLSVSQSRTFKPDLFAKAVPPTTPEAVTAYYKLVPDSDKIKAALAPKDLEKYTQLSKKSVKVL